MWNRFFGLMAVIIAVACAWTLSSDAAPQGVIVEQPGEFGPLPDSPLVVNPFGQTAAVDPEGKQLVIALHLPADAEVNVSKDFPLLSEFAGPHRQLLLRHIATSAKWFLGIDMSDGKQSPIARRRFVYGGMWHNPMNGYVWGPAVDWRSFPDYQFRILLGIDGLDIVTSESKDKTIIASGRSALELFEQSPVRRNQFTRVAVSQLQRELQEVLASTVARTRGFSLSRL